MTLTTAIEMVCTDTLENTSPDMTVQEIVDMVRDELTGCDLDVIESPELRAAYNIVRAATQQELDNRINLIDIVDGVVR